MDLSAGYALTAHWKATVKASLLRAWDKQADDWLIQMPADRYEAELQYDFGNGKKLQDSYVKINLQQVLKQTRVPDSGNIEKQLPDGTVSYHSDYAPPPGGYLLTNVEAGTKLLVGRQPLFLVLSVNNLFDVAYRDYMNAFRYYALDMGRNIGLRVKIPLGVKKQ
jgi:iron complex outermembrane receptor protein